MVDWNKRHHFLPSWDEADCHVFFAWSLLLRAPPRPPSAQNVVSVLKAPQDGGKIYEGYLPPLRLSTVEEVTVEGAAVALWTLTSAWTITCCGL